MRTSNMLVVTETGHCSVRPVQQDLRTLQQLVGGWVEQVTLDGEGVFLLCDEEGRLKRKPINTTATRIADRFMPGFIEQDTLVGTVAFAVMDGEDYGDVPDHVVAVAEEISGREVERA